MTKKKRSDQEREQFVRDNKSHYDRNAINSLLNLLDRARSASPVLEEAFKAVRHHVVGFRGNAEILTAIDEALTKAKQIREGSDGSHSTT